jgi:hypothetical protein|tara:strand:+ start:25 stop:3102 length:3078 start_codon:yes stop_codon:yes gene_type:complete
MSTQLILYPQYYQGFSSTASPSTTQFVTNGVNFTGLNSTLLHNTNSTQPSQDAITNAPPTILGNWYRFTTIGGPPGNWGAVAAPQVAAGSIYFNVAAPEGHTGVYQKLSGLIPGAIYHLKIAIVTPQVGLLSFETYSGSTIQFQQLLSSNTNVATATFTATTSNDIILIDYFSGLIGLLVTNISVKQSAQSPSLIYTDLEDGQVICDLYQEEDIPLSLSIDDFKNVAEQVKSYSKDFSLPATKRNNQIFSDMYEVTRSVAGSVIFNPYVKTKCVLKQDGFVLFEGYLRLINVKDQEGEISYNVNLYSEVIALADILKDKKFRDLDFDELKHDYNKASIKNSWYPTVGVPLSNPITTASFAYDANLTSPTDHTSVLKYPFIDWNHQYIVGGNGSANATVGNPELVSLEQAFRPCIQVKYLINKIFSAAGFNWTSDFFNTSIANGGDFDFDNLFMDFNWGGDATPNSIVDNGLGKYQAGDADSVAPVTFASIEMSSDSFDDTFGYDDATHIFTCPVGQDNSTYTIGYNARFRCYETTQATRVLHLRWLHTDFATGAQNVIDATPSTGITMETSASATITNFTTASGIQVIDIVDGGYYAGGTPPIVTFVGAWGSNAAGTANMVGNQVDSVTMTTFGSGYYYSTKVVFNDVDPCYTYSGNIAPILNEGDTLQLQMEASAALCIRQDNVPLTSSFNSSIINTATLIGTVTMTGVTNSILLHTLRGELGQWEFLKGIMTMFNLVTMIDETNPENILIEPYADVFINNTNSGSTGDLTLAARGVQHDWTDKVDVSEMELKPLTDLNKDTAFKFIEDDDDYVFGVYKKATSGHLYGSYLYDASGFTILEGEKEIIAEPFAATVSKPIDDQFPDFIIPSIYSMNEDGTSEGFDNAPRILYNNGRKNTGATFFIPSQNGLYSENQPYFLQFSHLTTVPTISTDTNDFLFRSEQLIEPIGDAPTNNLYSRYWQPYFNELYSPDTRTMTIKVNLSPSDVSSFKFYDTVFIKNRAFRVNKIDYKPNDLAIVEFILIP